MDQVGVGAAPQNGKLVGVVKLQTSAAMLLSAVEIQQDREILAPTRRDRSERKIPKHRVERLEIGGVEPIVQSSQGGA
jgi:hypothetical protein